MIFLSHNHKDKAVVEQVAARLAAAFGQEQVFYDAWSIQPGDGIIDRMNSGLRDCKAFIFFVSKNSLLSKMVDLEWQNAVMKAASGDLKIIPVKLDDCLMPAVLTQTLYVDMFSNGLEIGLRQLMDVLQGRSTFRPGPQQFQNLRGYVRNTGDATDIELRALHFLEPISSFVVLVENDENDVDFTCTSSGGMHTAGFNKGVTLTDGRTVNGQLLGIERATTPDFPFIITARPRAGKQLRLVGVLHQKGHNRWEPVPLEVEGGLQSIDLTYSGPNL